MAELLLGQPLFPGESGVDQLVEIIKVLPATCLYPGSRPYNLDPGPSDTLSRPVLLKPSI